MSDRKRTVIGVAWYRPEQWRRLVEISVDREVIEGSYEEWLGIACTRSAELAAAGYRLERVDVDVEKLLAWCLAQGRPVDGPARSEYAAKLTREARTKRARPT